MSTLAVITARGGSKRIPNKNIRMFDGKPIIAYSIETAIASQLFDDVIVTTDSEEIATISKSYGASIPFIRNENLADDFTGTVAVVADAIEQIAKMGQMYQYVCCIYPTAPMIMANDLADAYDMVRNENVHYVFSATKHRPSIYRALKDNSKGNGIAPVFDQYIDARSQDLSPSYYDAGQFYWGTSSAFTDDSPIFSKHSRMFLLPHHRVCDIDTEDDWIRAEAMFCTFKKQT